jgi:hypothetical protein
MKRRTSSFANTKASTWFDDVHEFRQLCGDAQSQASSESAQEFAAQMMLAANQHGLEAYLSLPQLEYLCRLADRDVPARRTA